MVSHGIRSICHLYEIQSSVPELFSYPQTKVDEIELWVSISYQVLKTFT